MEGLSPSVLIEASSKVIVLINLKMILIVSKHLVKILQSGKNIYYHVSVISFALFLVTSMEDMILLIPESLNVNNVQPAGNKIIKREKNLMHAILHLLEMRLKKKKEIGKESGGP